MGCYCILNLNFIHNDKYMNELSVTVLTCSPHPAGRVGQWVSC